MVDTPLDRAAEDWLCTTCGRIRRHSGESPRRSIRSARPRQILHELEKDHPAPSKLLQAFRDVLGGLRDFIAQHNIVDIPSPVLPIVEETPPFMRALTIRFHGHARPLREGRERGVLQRDAAGSELEAASRVEEHMAGVQSRARSSAPRFMRRYPGHYVQFLWVQQAPSKVRKLLGANSNAEGWAHYCEQMMLDEGYGNGDPKMRLGQLQDALLRNARYIVGIQMHTGKDDIRAEACEFFVKEGYQVTVDCRAGDQARHVGSDLSVLHARANWRF